MRFTVFIFISQLFLCCACQKDVAAPVLSLCAENGQCNAFVYKGVSIEAPQNPVADEVFDQVVDLGANYAALIPFGIAWSEGNHLSYDMDLGWWGEKTEGVTQMTHAAHTRGLKVMLKPQVWFAGTGEYTGRFDAGSEEDWQTFEQDYYDYIIHFSDLAQDLNIELFVVGTEFGKFAKQRPAFWGSLIDSVRAHYDGMLTYASNWDDYDEFPHWNKLDVIGVDAYFPVSNAKTPTAEEVKDGWKKYLDDLEDLSNAYQKQIIFAEYGYRSVDFCAKEPWDWDEEPSVNLEGQTNAYRGLYASIADRAWMQGGFFWKWVVSTQDAGGENDNRFTPQGKPVIEVIKEKFSH